MTPKLIIRIVCQHFNTNYEYEKLHSDDRHLEHLIVRFYCFIFIKENTNLSVTQIGMLFDQDHSTVLNGIRKLKNWMETDISKKKIYEKLNLIINFPTDKINRKSHLEVKMIYRRLKNPKLTAIKHKNCID